MDILKLISILKFNIQIKDAVIPKSLVFLSLTQTGPILATPNII